MVMQKKNTIPALRFEVFTDDWEQHKLGDIADSYSGGTPTVGIKEYYGGNIPFIRSADINNTHTELYITESGLKNSSAKLVSKGDILYALYGATSGEVGRAKLDGAINQAILVIKPHSNYDKEYITQWLQKNKQNIIDVYLQGGQGNLSGRIVNELILDFSSLQEQQFIGSYFKCFDNLISLHQHKYDQLCNTKKALLEKMFPREGAVFPEIRFVGFSDAWEQCILGEKVNFNKGTGYSKADLEQTGTPIILYGRLYTDYETVIRDVNTYVCAKPGSV